MVVVVVLLLLLLLLLLNETFLPLFQHWSTSANYCLVI